MMTQVPNVAGSIRARKLSGGQVGTVDPAMALNRR
jgi:hypothetical protein